MRRVTPVEVALGALFSVEDMQPESQAGLSSGVRRPVGGVLRLGAQVGNKRRAALAIKHTSSQPGLTSSSRDATASGRACVPCAPSLDSPQQASCCCVVSLPTPRIKERLQLRW